MPRATRSPGRVATRLESVGSQCSILGPFKTHLCGGKAASQPVGSGAQCSSAMLRSQPAPLPPTHLTVRCSEKQTKRRRRKRRKVML